MTPVSSTRLQVSWEEPDNAGPPITDYDYRYREASGSWTEVTNTTITGTTVTIEGLSASTSYDVEVRAKNAEGTSDWSNPGSRSDERRRGQQPARVHRGHERHAKRERKRAGGHLHRCSRHGDGRRFGRHADLQPRRTGRGLVRCQRYIGAASHEVRHHADRRRDVHGDGRGRRRKRHRQDFGYDQRYGCAAEQPARVYGGRQRRAERECERAGGYVDRRSAHGHRRRRGHDVDLHLSRARTRRRSASTRQTASSSRWRASPWTGARTPSRSSPAMGRQPQGLLLRSR